jgi:hypothetical protein
MLEKPHSGYLFRDHFAGPSKQPGSDEVLPIVPHKIMTAL